MGSGISDIIALVGDSIEIPCKTSLYGDEEISLILWYKLGSGAPIYTVDARSNLLSKSEHLNHNPRMHLDVLHEPPTLIINPVHYDDSGEYRFVIYN